MQIVRILDLIDLVDCRFLGKSKLGECTITDDPSFTDISKLIPLMDMVEEGEKHPSVAFLALSYGTSNILSFEKSYFRHLLEKRAV